MKPNQLDNLLSQWQKEPTIRENIDHWRISRASMGEYAPFPADLEPAFVEKLQRDGINKLYSHQREAWDAIKRHENIVMVTSTASGKTLAYTLPVIQAIRKDKNGTAFFLFPTKALGADQLDGLQEWNMGENIIKSASYDGDTPSSHRKTIRNEANIILTNPDMLHIGILPHHTRWERFLRNLRYIVIDEMHIYRGVFGSHFSNVMRRLKRITDFYGASPQFILTSATIANPEEHACRLIDKSEVTLIDHDGAPHGDKHFLLYNPPIINEDLGIRLGASVEAIRLVSELYDKKVQTILFSRTRRGVEIILKQLRGRKRGIDQSFRAYRSGYLAGERREIEADLRSGTTQVVVSTSALELGIDIGGMDASVLVGYPGTIAATLQQAGRAGRGLSSSCAVLVASANPLDQYLVQHPEFIFDKTPEKVLINPDNLLILLKHMRCAAFELPFKKEDHFGRLDPALFAALIQVLVDAGFLFEGREKYFWIEEQYTSGQISLRSTSESTFILELEEEGRRKIVGEVDEISSYWMVHPQAVYLHGGDAYYVESLDFEKKRALLSRFRGDYYTEALKDVTLEKIGEPQRIREVQGAAIFFGEIMVTSQVVGFRRISWVTRQIMDITDQLMPANELRTTAYWIKLEDSLVNTLREEGLWNNDANEYGPTWNAIRKLAKRRDEFRCQHCGSKEGDVLLHIHHKQPFRSFESPEQANRLENLVTLCPSCHHEAENSLRMRSGLNGLRYVLHNLAPLHLMCDMGDLDSDYDAKSTIADQKPAIVIYEQIPGGIGLTDALFDVHDQIVRDAYDLVSNCSCKAGCPSCVGPVGENGTGGKEETLALLGCLCGLDREDIRGIIG